MANPRKNMAATTGASSILPNASIRSLLFVDDEDGLVVLSSLDGW